MRYIVAQSDPGIQDNSWPEGFRFPFGEWIKQLVFWAVNNPVTKTIGDIVEWPFKTFFNLIMSEEVGRDSIMTLPWIWVVIGIFLVASFTRNTKVGLACAAMLTVCGFLGAQYWEETAKTIGMILVSTTLCAIVGIPLGILSGRFDSVWNVVRPTLDAMQVVHSFVFMLPFIFFFGIGEVSATMVTMVFALPPLVRLTNLGIRQVPEDVVEASRAFGAPERRVLTDVQLPLARPAIMTGLNQTLLLAISMLGIAALMGAGGLGRLLFRAINNLDLGLAASGGLAFFLVAVILDRISQTEAQDGIGLLAKVRQAWQYRANPEGLLEVHAENAAANTAVEAEKEPDERPAPVTAGERMGLLVATAGGLLAIVSVFLPWANDAGLVASWARFTDENMNGELAGQSFAGWEASGGTIFGVVVALLALFAIGAAVRPLLSPPASLSPMLLKIQGALLAALAGIIALIFILNLLDVGFGPLPDIGLAVFALCAVLIILETFVTGTPRQGADGVTMLGLGSLITAIAYLTMGQSDFLTGYSHGIGLYLAIAAGLVMVAGGVMALMNAPYGPKRPLSVDPVYGIIGAAGMALLLIVGSAFGVGDAEKKTEFGWLFDERIDAIQRGESNEIPADIQAQIDELEAEARADPSKMNGNALAVANLMNSLQSGSRIVHTGVSDGGPQLGWLAMILAGLGVLVAIPAAGLFGASETRRWQAAVVLAGIGAGIMGFVGSFILGLVRVATGVSVIAGVGAFLTFIAGFVIFAAGRGVVSEFQRKKVYGAAAKAPAAVTPDLDLRTEDELAESLA